MNNFFVLIYFTCFAAIAGGAFAMMWANIQSINKEMAISKNLQHPEAPQEGEEVMYVDLNRDRLESIYNNNNNSPND
jgi:hypothetical protein